MYKIKLIIPTFDRPAQLDLLLRSVALNGNDLFEPVVLMRWSNDEFKQGYWKVFDRIYSEPIFEPIRPVVMIPEEENGGFSATLKYELDNKTPHEMVCFATDDTILYRRLEASYEEVKTVVTLPQISTLSLRVGLDTTIETYYKGNALPRLIYFEFGDMDNLGKFIAWNNKSYNPNSAYGYSMSIDFHIYETKFIKNLIDKINFDNPNTLEGNLAGFSHRAEMPPYMAAMRQQHALAVPINSVANWNRAGDKYPRSTKELNDLYLEGACIFAQGAINEALNIKDPCTHNEINFSFYKYPYGK
jgi:hypothetical protein